MSSFLNVHLTGCNSPWFPEEMTANFMPWPLGLCLSKTSAGVVEKFETEEFVYVVIKGQECN